MSGQEKSSTVLLDFSYTMWGNRGTKIADKKELLSELPDDWKRLEFEEQAMFFRIDTRKAIEAAATLLRLAPHRLMGRKRLLVLLSGALVDF